MAQRPCTRTGQERSPLSWHLSIRHRSRIRQHHNSVDYQLDFQPGDIFGIRTDLEGGNRLCACGIGGRMDTGKHGKAEEAGQFSERDLAAQRAFDW